MTKRWKLKTNSSNILLVLITLILVKAEWVKGENSDSPHYTNSLANSENQSEETNIYVGNDEIAEYFFSQSANNNSYVMEGINKCLDNFQLITCVKMLLLSRINDAVSLMEDPNFIQRDFRLLRGVLVFKLKNATNDSVPEDSNEDLSLDEEIVAKVKRIFWRRSLLINLLPKVQIEIEPAPEELSDFVCFKYTVRQVENSIRNDESEKPEGRKKRKGGGMSMMMMVPQLIMLGLMPFTLASLKVCSFFYHIKKNRRKATKSSSLSKQSKRKEKPGKSALTKGSSCAGSYFVMRDSTHLLTIIKDIAMVMNAVMINMMALNGAIFMTIRNLVFGPRKGDNVKYVNYGYSKDRQTQSKRPVLIIHSPAAFVKQPPVHKKPNHVHFSKHHLGGNAHSPHHYHHQNEVDVDDHGNKYYYTVQDHDENHYRRRGQSFRRRNDPRPVSGV